MTLSELIAFEVPAILIPYPHAADNHQKKNAERKTQNAKLKHFTAFFELQALHVISHHKSPFGGRGGFPAAVLHFAFCVLRLLS